MSLIYDHEPLSMSLIHDYIWLWALEYEPYIWLYMTMSHVFTRETHEAWLILMDIWNINQSYLRETWFILICERHDSFLYDIIYVHLKHDSVIPATWLSTSPSEYVPTCACVCIVVYTWACIHVCICVCVNMCVHIHIYIYIHTHTHTCIYILYIHLYVYIYIYHIYIYIYHICIYIYIYLYNNIFTYILNLCIYVYFINMWVRIITLSIWRVMIHGIFERHRQNCKEEVQEKMSQGCTARGCAGDVCGRARGVGRVS